MAQNEWGGRPIHFQSDLSHTGYLWPSEVGTEVIRRLSKLLEAVDPALAGHSRRTAHIAINIAEEMRIEEDQYGLLSAAALLHDVGKLFVSREILDKPGPLSADEWMELEHHPRIGYEMVRDRVDPAVASIVLSHHERIDGAGYPRGLDDTAIPPLARILQVADAFDAITSHRCYQPAMPIAYALSELDRNAGTQFDPEPVAAITALASQPSWNRLGYAAGDLSVVIDLPATAAV